MLAHDHTTAPDRPSAPETQAAQAVQAEERPGPPARSQGAAIVGWLLTIALNVAAPIITYNALRDQGWSEFAALLAGGAWPVLDSAVHLVWRRRLDEFAVVTLVFLVITAVVSLIGSHSTQALLVKDSAISGLFGLLCLATLLAPRPLMFYFGRKFATDGTAASTAWWNGMWQFEGFRSTTRTMTTVWGVAYCLEAVVRIALAYIMSTDTVVVLSPILMYGVLGALILWTTMYGKRSRRRGEERAAAATV
ncbi:VC0807 family protein [Streptomyces sp. N2A]|uniref:VC0807 family protein n=1 Tax=Streptomyces sp. N2A TaxID=3073936 RepID=UPI00286FD3E3|nr:VC0807 family protein [Streptomyces sp. N2A]